MKTMLKRLDLIQETLKVLKKLWLRKMNPTAMCRRDQRVANWRQICSLLAQIQAKGDEDVSRGLLHGEERKNSSYQILERLNQR